MNIFLDIETLPGRSDLLMDSLRADADKEKAAARAPSNYKDEAKIAEYIAARHAEIDASMEDKRLKTSFDGMFGSIACIAYAVDDEQVASENALSDGGEAAMLERLYTSLASYTSTEYQGGMASMDAVFIGHNIADFDLQFLKHRSIILSVRPPPALAKAMAAKPWDKCIADTMLMWSPSREKRVGLDKLCRVLGVPGKGEFDGSMVAETWPVDPQKVIDYCNGDVERVRAIYRRMTFS